jgi:hypothetical protein
LWYSAPQEGFTTFFTNIAVRCTLGGHYKYLATNIAVRCTSDCYGECLSANILVCITFSGIYNIFYKYCGALHLGRSLQIFGYKYYGALHL